MSWQSKVCWSEGLFLKPQHFQQSDRYFEQLLEARVRQVTPYPWGFSALEIDRDLLQQGRVAIRRAAGVLPDGTPFDVPGRERGPDPVEISDMAAGQFVWLTLPLASVNTREVASRDKVSAARYFADVEILIDSSSELRQEEEVELAHLRLSYDVRKTPKPGHVCVGVARVLEVRDGAVVLDDKYVPPLLVTAASSAVLGWVDRVIGWIDAKLEELSRYAADPTAGGGLQNADYLMLQLLNRSIPVFSHFRQSIYVHPERLFVEMTKLAGELATFASTERRARAYAAYNHDDLEAAFAPVLRDVQDYLSARLSRRALRLEIVERAANAFVSVIRDRSLFRNATFVLEVGAARQLSEIQAQFPNLFKLGPNSKMNEIVHTHLPGVPLVHLPTPPSQIRAITDHVYFYLDKRSPLWAEFSTASSIGMHFSGEWPELSLELWAVLEDRR